MEEELLKVIEDLRIYGHSREVNWHRTKELLWVLSRYGRATTSVASDTATFEHSMYRWQLIHKDLLQSGMTQTADILRKEEPQRTPAAGSAATLLVSAATLLVSAAALVQLSKLLCFFLYMSYMLVVLSYTNACSMR